MSAKVKNLPVPRPRKIDFSEGNFRLTGKINLCFPKGIDGKISGYIEKEFRQWAGPGFSLSRKNESASIKFVRKKQLSEIRNNPEGYVLKVNRDSIDISALTEKGLFYAFQTLLDLIDQHGDGKRYIPCCNIIDWPEFEWRGFLIDPARQFIPVDTIFLYADYMCRAKMNKFHIHFTDNESYTLPTKLSPVLTRKMYHYQNANGPKTIFTFEELKELEKKYAGPYSVNDIKRIVDYCQERMIEVIPEIGMPSHSAPIIKAFPEIQCRVEGKTSETVFCIGNEKTYEILEKIIAENIPLFPSEYVNIGGDEIECRDIKFKGFPFYCQIWDKCTVCKEKMKSEGFSSTNELFYYFVRRMGDILAKYGKKPMIWNDYIDSAKPFDLPNDTTIGYWQVAMKNRGPHRGCSFNKLLKSGLKIINANSLDTYVDEERLMREKRILKWHPRKRPYADKKLRKNIIGSMMLTWGLWKHYKRTLPSAMAIFGDRLWNSAEIKNSRSFGNMISRHLFGPGLPEEIYRIFEYNGSLIPPRKNDILAYLEEERVFPEVSLNELKETLKTVKKVLCDKNIPNRRALEEYAGILEWQIAERES